MDISMDSRTREVAHLTFKPTGGAVCPATPPLAVGSFFRDADGGQWEVIEFTMMEEREPFPDSYAPPREYWYFWRHVVVRVQE